MTQVKWEYYEENMGNVIDGVKTKKLKVIPDERGRLMEMLRCDDEIFYS